MIRNLNQVGAADVALVGGKAAGLGEMIGAGLPVPDGFCLTAQAYRAAIEPLRATMAGLLAAGEHERLRDLVAGAPPPAGLAEQVGAAVEALGTPVAVRSSATAEDLPEASFAGQQETILGVVGGPAVMEAIGRCWASLWTDRAIAYRQEQGFAHDDVALAVVVQTMVAAQAAGVAFTADPLTGRRGAVTIESAWGLGESVVCGAVTPDSFQVPHGPTRPAGPTRLTRRIGDKHQRIDLTPTGATLTRPTTAAERARASLTDSQARQVAALARRVEAHTHRPMDIEWAVADDGLWLLQARPITTAVEAHEWADSVPGPGEPAPVAGGQGAPRRALAGPGRRLVGRAGRRPGSGDGRAGIWGRRRPGRLSRFVRTDIIEHFPSPYPLDAALTEIAVRCVRATSAVAGIRMDSRSPLSIDDDGLVRVAHPHLTLWGLPWGVLHVAALPWSDPRQWGMREGARARAAAERLAALPATRLPTAALAGALGRTLAEIEALERARFIGYLGFHVLRGARIDMLLRLARTRYTQYDLLGDLDYATVVISRELAALAAAAPEPVRALLARGVRESGAPAAGAATGAAARGAAETAAEATAGVGPGTRAGGGTGAGRAEGTAAGTAAGAGPVEVEEVRAAGPQWWDQAEAFLARHGSRGTTMYQAFSSPSWREDLPAFLTAVGLTMRDGQDPEGRSGPGGPARHAQIMEEVEGRLPRALRPGFRRLVADYRAGHLMREDSVVEFERLSAVARGLALEAGRRMCEAGLIDQPGQVVYLSLEELRSWLRGGEVDVAAIVRRRLRARPRAEAAWWEGQEEGRPVAVGAELAGVGASPGTITAPARVIGGPADFERLQPGEVLVCRSTEPAWTPLFARAVAVVAETGGRLSHAAIVAREYSIPAVLGIAGATTLIADGELLTVDGTRGRVRRGG